MNHISAYIIAENVYNLRKEKGVTQNEMADELGYNVRTIRRIESEGTNKIDVINDLATYFKVTALDILTDER